MKHASPAFTGDVRLRAANPEDRDRLLLWANDTGVRQSAFQTEPIPAENHEKWFNAKLADQDCLIAILENERGVALGQFRAEKTESGLLIDLSVERSQRGQGIGRALLNKGLEAASQRWPQAAHFTANVLDANPRSQALFLSCGFQRTETGDRNGKRYHVFIKPLAKG